MFPPVSVPVTGISQHSVLLFVPQMGQFASSGNSGKVFTFLLIFFNFILAFYLWKLDPLTVAKLLEKRHAEVMSASNELADGGDFEGADQLDNEALTIEEFMESQFGMVWDGEKFSNRSLFFFGARKG